MKKLIIMSIISISAMAASAAQRSQICEGFDRNTGVGTLVITENQLSFSGTQLDAVINVNRTIECQASNPTETSSGNIRYSTSGNCGVFTHVLLTEDGKLYLNDDSGSIQPEMSAIYSCK